MVRVLAFLMLGLLVPLFARTAFAQDMRPPVQFKLEIESTQGEGNIQQMIIVRLHGRYVRPIALWKMPLSELQDFQVVNLGPGRWFTQTGDGFETLAYELTLGLFPKRSGDLIIPPFVQDLTYIDRQSERVSVKLATEATRIEVKPALVNRGAWWLPASDVTVDDDWSADPSNLQLGETVRRTITLKATGQLPNQLPPPPNLKSDGLIVSAATPVTKLEIGLAPADFARQAKKSRGRPNFINYVESDRAKPISTVVYSWLIRPTKGEPVEMAPLQLDWFDTDTGKAETIVIPGKKIAFRDPGPSLDAMEHALGISAEKVRPSSRWALLDALATALVFAIALVTSLAIFSSTFRAAATRVARAAEALLEMRRMRLAAKRGDATSVWRIHRRICASVPLDQLAPAVGKEIARLQAAVFGTQNVTPRELQAIAATISPQLLWRPSSAQSATIRTSVFDPG